MENKPFHINSNILANKKKSSKFAKKATTKRPKKSKGFVVVFIIVVSLFIGFAFWIKDFTNSLIKDFSDGKIVVCKDRLVSKELGYLFYKNENAFVNKKDGLFFTAYYCSSFDK